MLCSPGLAHLGVCDLANELEQRATLHLQPRNQLAVYDQLHPFVFDAHDVAIHVEVNQPAGVARAGGGSV